MTALDLAKRLKTNLVWGSGLVKLAELRGQSASALIGFDRVRPPQRMAYQPRRSCETAPATLDRLISALKRWRVDIVSIDEACSRMAETTPHRFVSLSFNGAYRDMLIHARPVLAAHDVSYTVYVPSAFPDNIGLPWWLALEAAIAPHDRISLIIDRKEHHFVVADADAKMQLYHFLFGIMRPLPPAALAQMVDDLCTRYGVDLAALTSSVALSWDDLAILAADPRITIGSATVNYPVLANVDQEIARREITMGRAVLETALHRPVRHLAFPFGDKASFKTIHADMAEDEKFASAVTAIPGTLRSDSDPHRLPRIVWTPRMTLRGLHARLAGY